MEIARGRLVATRMSLRVLRVLPSNWNRYLNDCATRGLAESAVSSLPRVHESEGGAS
jgi:hypothetical protein